jgi:hypothetical protein
MIRVETQNFASLLRHIVTIALQCFPLRETVMRILKLEDHHFVFHDVKLALNIHQKILLALFSTTFILLLYEEIFHTLLNVLHGLFESAEHLLDIIIDAVFETSTHETQVIVFYILVPVILLTLYLFYRRLPHWYRHFKESLHQQKLETLAQWHGLPLIQRFEWWSFFVLYISCFIFFSF